MATFALENGGDPESYLDAATEQAEEILTGLVWRIKQKGMNPSQARSIADLGRRLSVQFEAQFGWEPGRFDRLLAYDRVITVRKRL